MKNSIFQPAFGNARKNIQQTGANSLKLITPCHIFTSKFQGLKKVLISKLIVLHRKGMGEGVWVKCVVDNCGDIVFLPVEHRS